MIPLLEAARGTAFGVICGHECYYLRGLERGATGVLGGGSMIVPEIQYAVQVRFCAGDRAGARPAWHQSWRSTNMVLISAIACAGLRPLGQALAQLRIVWQR